MTQRGAAAPDLPRSGWIARLPGPDRLNRGEVVVLAWFLTRLAVVAAWALVAPASKGDVGYYFRSLAQMATAGPAQTLVEYPTPVVWLLLVPWYLGGRTLAGYVFVFVCLVLILDAVFTWTLWRTGGRLRGAAALFWTAFVTLIGPTAYFRFDLIPAVLSGWAVILVLHHRRAGAGALIGLGAAVKLWPVLLWPALRGDSRRHTLLAAAGTFVTGGLLALASLAWAGWGRLISPLAWQSGRGLQIESLWASVPMLIRALGRGDYAVTQSRFQAFEIWGTGVSAFSLAAGVAAFTGYGVIVATFVAWWVRGRGPLMEGCVLMVFVVVVLLVTDKTFSPQYVLWLGGPLAAAVVTRAAPGQPSDPLDGVRLRRVMLLALWIAALTVLVFPIGYFPLTRDLTGWLAGLRLPVTLVLLARNALVVWLLVVLIRWIWSFLRPLPSPRARASAPATADSR